MSEGRVEVPARREHRAAGDVQVVDAVDATVASRRRRTSDPPTSSSCRSGASCRGSPAPGRGRRAASLRNPPMPARSSTSRTSSCSRRWATVVDRPMRQSTRSRGSPQRSVRVWSTVTRLSGSGSCSSWSTTTIVAGRARPSARRTPWTITSGAIRAVAPRSPVSSRAGPSRLVPSRHRSRRALSRPPCSWMLDVRWACRQGFSSRSLALDLLGDLHAELHGPDLAARLLAEQHQAVELGVVERDVGRGRRDPRCEGGRGSSGRRCRGALPTTVG